jgi:putative nucleotidyltransferase with HDIG domain
LLELGAIEKEQVIGKKIDSLNALFDEKGLQDIENDLIRLMRGEPAQKPFEVRAITGGNKPCYFNAKSINFTDARGNVTGELVILRDITDNKLIENELRKSKQRISAQYRGIPIPTYTWQKSGDDFVLADFNDAAAKAGMGIANDLIGSKATEALDRMPGEIDAMELCLEGKSVLTREMEFQGSNSDKARQLSINYAFVPPDIVLVHSDDITDRKEAENAIKTSNERLRQILDGTVHALAITAEKKDPSTAGHQARVAQLATAIAEEMGMGKDMVEGIRVAGMLHDIGKISIPAEILSKPGRLNEMEMSIIRMHCQESYDILRTIDFPWPVAEIALQHHERMNGTGYPSGITGEKIITEARIMAVADVVEAMISHRSYRPSLAIPKAIDEIRRNRGVLYDLQVVDICCRLFSEKGFVFEETGEPTSEDPDIRS